MSSLGWTPGQLHTFDRLASIIGARGRGVTLTQLGSIGALARELDQPEPDEDRVVLHLDALDLTEHDVEALVRTGET